MFILNKKLFMQKKKKLVALKYLLQGDFLRLSYILPNI